MSDDKHNEAWNNFVFNSQPEDYERGTMRRAAALAKEYMGQATRGGINSYLTNYWQRDVAEVIDAMKLVGALAAANQLNFVYGKLGVALPPMIQDERWNLLERHWSEELNSYDALSSGAYDSLMRSLETHVDGDINFYLGLGE